MELNKLYDIAEREHIDVINFKMKNKAIIGNYQGASMIGLNYSKIDTYSEEKCLLAEELGHYYYSSYYTLMSDQNFIDKQEYRANKWSYLVLIPYKDLKSAILKRKQYGL